MSRIGKLPIQIPQGVEVKLDGLDVVAKGPLGSLRQTVGSKIKVQIEDTVVRCVPESDDPALKAQWGLYRVLVNNLVVGVSTGFKKVLEMTGVGYRGEIKGKNLVLHVGYSHPVEIEPPEGISFAVEGPTKVVVNGIDKQVVGQVASDIRKVRPPEPYKGKGIRYSGEEISRKAGKSGVK